MEFSLLLLLAPVSVTPARLLTCLHAWIQLPQQHTPLPSATVLGNVLLCRKRRPELRRRSFMDGGAMTWHGKMPYQAEWTEETRLVAFSVSSAGQGGLYCAFNTSHRPQTVTLPHWPGLVWQPVMDSGKVDMT